MYHLLSYLERVSGTLKYLNTISLVGQASSEAHESSSGLGADVLGFLVGAWFWPGPQSFSRQALLKPAPLKGGFGVGGSREAWGQQCPPPESPSHRGNSTGKDVLVRVPCPFLGTKSRCAFLLEVEPRTLSI